MYQKSALAMMLMYLCLMLTGAGICAKGIAGERKFAQFVGCEGNAVDAYEVTGYPTTYFIDASGNPVAYASGMIDYNTLVSGIDMIR